MPPRKTPALPADPAAAYTQLAASTGQDILRTVAAYRPRLPEGSPPELATLIRVGLLGVVAAGRAVSGTTTWATTRHVLACYDRGADLTVPGVWASAQVERTLAVGVGGLDERSVTSMAAPLRRASRALVPAGQPHQPAKAGRYNRVAPYGTVALARIVEHVTGLPEPMWRARASLLVALTVGAGLTDADLRTVTRASLTVTERAVIVAVGGQRARRVPVRHDLEDLAVAAHDLLLGADPRFAGAPTETAAVPLLPGRGVASILIDRLAWPTAPPNGLRLRATWAAFVLASGCGVPAYLRAAHITSIDSWYAAVPLLPELDEALYLEQVRGAAGTVRLARPLDGSPWPSPVVPLREDTR